MPSSMLLSPDTSPGICELIVIAHLTFSDHIVFVDIDDTLIDSNTLSLNLHVYRIYRLLQSKGCRMVIITAREFSTDSLQYTKTQLSDHRITFDKLYLRPESMTNPYVFKEYYRALEVELTGKKPLCSIGDQLWDIGPGYAGIPILVKRT